MGIPNSIRTRSAGLGATLTSGESSSRQRNFGLRLKGSSGGKTTDTTANSAGIQCRGPKYFFEARDSLHSCFCQICWGMPVGFGITSWTGLLGLNGLFLSTREGYRCMKISLRGRAWTGLLLCPHHPEGGEIAETHWCSGARFRTNFPRIAG